MTVDFTNMLRLICDDDQVLDTEVQLYLNNGWDLYSESYSEDGKPQVILITEE